MRRRVPHQKQSSDNEEHTPLLEKERHYYSFNSQLIEEEIEVVPQRPTNVNVSTSDQKMDHFGFDSIFQKLIEILKQFLCAFQWNQTPEIYNYHLDEFKRKVSEVYNNTDENHEKLLMRLWDLSFPEEELESRISKKWQKLGFQGTDPSSDFRGAGIFGLFNLVYFAENYPEKFHSMLKKTNELEGYPFAISGLNITNMLFNLLGFGFKSNQKDHSASRKLICQVIFKDDENSDHIHRVNFGELFCLCFMILDHEWYTSKAQYMDFPRVIQQTTKRFEEILPNFKTVDQITDYIHSQFLQVS